MQIFLKIIFQVSQGHKRSKSSEKGQILNTIKDSQVITQTEALDKRLEKLTLEGSQGHPSFG